MFVDFYETLAADSSSADEAEMSVSFTALISEAEIGLHGSLGCALHGGPTHSNLVFDV